MDRSLSSVRIGRGLRFVAFVAFGAVTALSGAYALPARAAEPRDPAAAEALFTRAKQAQSSGDLERACPLFAESYRLDAAAGTLLNLADCEEAQGKLASAWQRFVDARAMLPAADFRLAYAEKRIAGLEPRVPRLTIGWRGGSREGVRARVYRDDLELGPPSLGVALPTDPGKHIVVVRADGFADSRTEVTLSPGEKRTIEVDLGPPLPNASNAPKVATSATTATESRQSTGRRNLAYVVGGAGIAALAVGTVSAFITIDAANRYDAHCQNGLCNQQGMDASSTGKTFEILSPIALGVGAVAVGVGAYLLLTKPKATGMIVSPTFAANGGGVVLGKAF